MTKEEFQSLVKEAFATQNGNIREQAAQLANEVGFSESALRKWCYGHASPPGGVMQALAPRLREIAGREL